MTSAGCGPSSALPISVAENLTKPLPPIVNNHRLLSEPTTANQPWWREPLLLPLCGRSLRSGATAYDAPLRHPFDAYFGRIIGSHALSFARTMRRRRAPERHDGHWGLAAWA